MTISDPALFKRAARQFASGVTVVTTRADDQVYGVTVSAFISLSINPLLVQVSINDDSPIIEQIERSGNFAVSVLHRGQEDVSRYFSTRGRGSAADRFPEIQTVVAATGVPIVADCLSYFDCELHSLLPGGDHRIIVGSVAAAGGSGGEPLLYYDGDYRALDRRRADSEAFADALSVQMHLTEVTPAELSEVQSAVEPLTAELAACNAGPDDLERLARLLANAECCLDDAQRFTELSIEFHSAVADAGGNRLLAASLRAVRRERHAIFAKRTDRKRAEGVLAVHREIYRLIEAKDATGARALMDEHVNHIGERLVGDQPRSAGS